MIPRFLRKTATSKLNLSLAWCGAGLLASLLTGCSGTTNTTAKDKATHTATAPETQTQALADSASNHTILDNTTISSHQHQHQQHYMHPAERVEQLKLDQLQAQANKVAYSNHLADINTTIQQTTTTSLPSQPHDAASSEPSQYTVEAGENLYAIAAKASIYQDGLLWPLIYKSNRDQIKDPEQIFPGQHLTISHKHSESEKEAARETARKSGIFIH